MLNMPPDVLAMIAAVFLAAGLVKGVVGMGLPTVSLALLTATLGVKQAIALMLVPSLAANVWQALAGNALKDIVRRLWSLLVTASLGIWFGSGLLARADANLVAGLLGILLCAYSAYSLAAPQIRPPGRYEPWLSPVIGAVAGIIAGLTGSFVVPGILYLQALGMARDTLVQAMGVVFAALTVALGISLSRYGLLSAELGAVSAAAIVPTGLGVWAGRRIRRRLPETVFRKVFFCALFGIGLYVAVRAFA